MNKFLFAVAALLGIFCLSKVECRTRMKRDFPVIEEVLVAHNNMRKVEKATNMKKMKWDPKLAELADIWAKGCFFGHGQPSSPTTDYDEVGQNLFTSSSVNPVNWTTVAQSWYNEKSYYTFADQTCLTGKMCGHYTQLVWADSEFLGCAVAYCDNLKGTRWTKGALAVCNYGPAGNYVGEDPYLKGEPCSACDGACEDGLCV